MSELEASSAYTVTLKAGRGFESPWLVLRAATQDDLDSILNDLQHTNTLGAVTELAAAFGKLYLESQPTTEPAPVAPERNNAPPVYGQQAQSAPQAPSQGGLVPNITVHPFKACQCGNPLVFKKNIVGKFGPSNVFECPMRDWQDDESKRAHDSVFVKA